MEILIARAPCYVGGSVIGILVTLLLWVANKPFGALSGYRRPADICARDAWGHSPKPPHADQIRATNPYGLLEQSATNSPVNFLEAPWP